MIKLVPSQPKWLASLIILVVATLLIVGGCMLANKSPVISSLTASEGRVSPSDSCQVRCVASDPDGDELSYTWLACGDISGEGSVVTWTAPAAPGDYTIAVKVSDGRGGEATEQLTIGVEANQPPVIDGLTAERERLRRAMSSTVECIASDPDGDKLSYSWSVDGGSISGEGSIATWVAPNTFGTYTVTVTVTDGRGGQAVETIDIVVGCCL